MEDHFTKECSVMSGKSGKARTMPLCARGNCKKVLFQPISCDKCHSQFCASHRFPSDHNCTPAPTPSTSNARSALPNPFTNANAKILNTKATAAGAATIGAVKKAAASAKVASQTLKPAASTPIPADTKPKASSSHSNPFSKTDRRAKAEKESRLKAMQARAKKGLLSEEEKAMLATEQQAAAEKKDDCIVM
ncbi:hypothetical protein C0991_003289 [Blastosporella zonata]|nr:hypothetical protein C0991_003289 [Blastosporella zonata]